METVKNMYGVTEAEWQWVTVIESWLADKMCFERVRVVSQLIIGRKIDGKIRMILPKLTNDLVLLLISTQ